MFRRWYSNFSIPKIIKMFIYRLIFVMRNKPKNVCPNSQMPKNSVSPDYYLNKINQFQYCAVPRRLRLMRQDLQNVKFSTKSFIRYTKKFATESVFRICCFGTILCYLQSTTISQNNWIQRQCYLLQIHWFDRRLDFWMEEMK